MSLERVQELYSFTIFSVLDKYLQFKVREYISLSVYVYTYIEIYTYSATEI